MKDPFAPSPSNSGAAGKKSKKSMGSVRPDPFTLSESEMLSQLPQAIGPSLFLDHFTFDEVSAQIESTSFLSAMKKKGVPIPRVELMRVDPDEHRLIVFDDSESEPVKMIELRLALTRMEVPALAGYSTLPSLFEMLAINWVMMQNPRAAFTENRPQLPGQEHPGLGLGQKCQEFLVHLGAELRRDGLVNHPQYFHNAMFYRDEYYFIDPRRQGELLAMFRDLARYPIGMASQAIADGRLIDVQRQIRVEWDPEGMVCPIHNPLGDYFQSREYREAVQRTLSSCMYDLVL
ncbi:MAG: hypothetical protein LAO31_11410 [Acidobacteriia bacterium]|nr:hypothetical protein [Terriglobia bacterium]